MAHKPTKNLNPALKRLQQLDSATRVAIIKKYGAVDLKPQSAADWQAFYREDLEKAEKDKKALEEQIKKLTAALQVPNITPEDLAKQQAEKKKAEQELAVKVQT